MRDIAATLPPKKQREYIEGIREIQASVNNMEKHCLKVLMFVGFLIIVQLEIVSSRLETIYGYATVPITAQIFHFLMAVVNHWAIVLAIIVAAETILRYKRPLVWEKFLLKAPIIKKIMLPFYYYRYYWTKMFGFSEESAMAATGNKAFSTKNKEMMREVKADYPLLHVATGIDKRKHGLSRDEYWELVQYAKLSLEFAIYDFREIVSYACIGITLLVTAVAGAMMLDIA